MKSQVKTIIAGLTTMLMLILPASLRGQSEKSVIRKYLTELPKPVPYSEIQKYRMTAVYTNRDLYGKFTGKQKISGEYTRGLKEGFVSWSNVFISGSDNFSEPFPVGAKQVYMENFKYIPSSKTLESGFFEGFPPSPDAVFAKNLVWDMMMIENFAKDYNDSLKAGRTYHIPEIKGEFQMADIGNYSHNDIQICWTGISAINDKLCAVIEYRALDNIIELSMDAIKTRGTEQYWGTTWIGLESGIIEYAEVYGGTIQEISVKGIENKFLIKTIRELWVEKIR